MSEENKEQPAAGQATAAKPDAARPDAAPKDKPAEAPTGEIGGPEGPEPTRFGDWEKAGRCSDF